MPGDPCLDFDGFDVAGADLVFRIHGPAGAEGILYLGRLPEIFVDPTQYLDQLTSRQREYLLGTFPASGFLEYSFPRPAWMTRGFTFFAQGEALLPGGERRLTNSVPVVIRSAP